MTTSKKIVYKARPYMRGEAYDVYYGDKYIGIVRRENRRGWGRGWECNDEWASSRRAAVACAIKSFV